MPSSNRRAGSIMEAQVLSAVVLVAIAPFIGSFLGTVIRRLPEKRPLLLGRSECEHCHRTLGWRDLVPVASWLAARGRCRHCGVAIGAFYPAVELAALAVALWSVAVTPGWVAWAGAGLGWTLLTLAWIDWRHYLLPDVLTLPLGLAGLAVAWLVDPARLLHHGIGVVAGFGGFAGLAWLYRKVRGRSGLGGGDAKLLGALGAWVAWWGLPTIVVYAAASGLVLVLAQAARGQRLALGHRLPFGPHLCLGGWLVWLYGPLLPG
jgi:leader peptidase (prepilin peptidase) / N-methyltransferase